MLVSADSSAYVVFGTRLPANIDLTTLGTRGFRIDGAGGPDSAVAGAGDVNGDGLADAPASADSSAYVVFGTRLPANIDLTTLGTRGFRIDGAGGPDSAVAGAGDVNGDGLPDMVVSVPFAGNNGRQGSGSAYVVFGTRSPANIDLAALGVRGFRIDGAAAGNEAGRAVAGAGDVNGDGLADVLVGAFVASNNARPTLVFGTRLPAK